MSLSQDQPLQDYVRAAPAVVLYFAGAECGVCHALWPRIESLLREEFPRILWRKIDVRQEREWAAQNGVFSVPTLICYFDGREGARLVRTFSLQQLRDALERPYQILFP
jgi:thioredoxin 1